LRMRLEICLIGNWQTWYLNWIMVRLLKEKGGN